MIDVCYRRRAMTDVQQTPATPERIFGAANAYQLSFALQGAINLDLFTAIAEGNTDAASIAQRCGASERGCRILCDFLTIHGLLSKSDGRWGLASDAALFLDRRSPMYIGQAFDFLHTPELISSFTDIAAVVRNGGTLSGDGTVEPGNPIWVKFARGMAPMMAPAAQDVAHLLGTGIEGRVLDIAAGHGLFGIGIAKANPGVRVTGLDWPAVLEVAAANAEAAGVASRYEALPGSAFEVEFGSGYEIVLLTNFLHHFDVPTCTGLLRKVLAALKPGGRAVTLEFVPNDDRVTPPAAAAFSMQMLGGTRGGDAYTFREFDSMFTEAGFSSTTMHELPRSPERVLISTR